LSVGLIVGLAQALYIGSAAFATAGRVLSIILWTAFGWGLYGAIVGGSGIFATEHIPKRLRQRIENEFKRTGIVVCAEPSYDATDIDAVKRELEAAGASNIYAERDA
jgi:hypothetical protein